MGKYTRGLLAVILAVVLVLPAAAFAMLPEANARSSTGMDGPEATKVVDHDTSNHWKFWAGGYDGSKVTTQNVGRIWTDKTVQAIDDGKSDFLTTLSAMSSTSDTTSLVSKPLDIVMVLDASGSMDDSMGGGDSTKRIVALKNAANHFIDTIAEQNKGIEDAEKQHKVAIVKFAGKKKDEIGNDTYRDNNGNKCNHSQTMKPLTPCVGDDATSLKETVNSIKPNGATQADFGMQMAQGITSEREGAQKIVVFFTDGSPTSSNGFEAEVAKDAINTAKTIKSGGATIYTIGIFNGAKPDDDPTSNDTSNKNKFMHAVSSNYPDATSSISYGFLGTKKWNVNFGNPVAGASYYKSATNAAELDQVFKDISSAITSGKGFPTKVEGNNPNGSGYITFEDELGAFMQVDGFTGAEYNGRTYGAATKSTDGNIDTYTFDGELAHLVITVDRADEKNPQRGDIVTVKVPASLIPLRRFIVDESAGTFVVDSTDAISPIRVAYASSVKAVARKNLFTPNDVPGLRDYINEHKDADSNTVSFYANKWTGDDAGDTVASFEPAATNSYYYFQKLTPVYTDAACTKLATEKPSGSKTYWYKDEFMAQNSSGAPYDDSVSIPVKGSELESFEGALVKDVDHWSIKAGTARLAFINQLHTTKERVGGNPTDTARDVINPQWNNTKVVSGATKVNVYLGNNGKINFTLNTKPTTLTTADFGLVKVLEGRDWTNEDKFEFGLTSEGNAPMPESKIAVATKGHAGISFGEIAYDKPGTYVYKVSEKHAGTTVDGIAYSDNVAEFTVTVKPNEKGKLEASATKTSGETEFKNTYAADHVESSVTDQIKATKSLTGRDLEADEFSFELHEVKGEGSELIETVKNDANGNVAFSPIEYTEIDQHTYTLREVKGNAGGITYDENVYTIVTIISDNGKGQLVATHKLKGAEDVKSIEFKNAYNLTPKSFSVTDKIAATKSLTGRDVKAGEFSFELVEGDKVVATGTNAADGKIAMTAIEYTEAGEHTYTLREVNGGTASNGISYDGKTYTIVTTITDNGDGTLKAEHVLKDAKVAEFKNAYNLTPTDSSVTDRIKATKFLTGRDLKEGEFSFELVEGDKVVATGKNAADGTVVMDKITYDKPGKHTYTLREVRGNVGGITYDAATYTIETVVKDNGDGTLGVEHKLKGADEAKFTNSYEPGSKSSSVTDQITAIKSLDGRDLKAGEFRFELVEGNNVVATGTNNADGKIVMDSVTYTAAGEHTYMLRETKAGATENGITYSTSEYTIVTIVKDNGDGALSVEHKLQNADEAIFENTYTVAPKSSSVTDQITATKFLTGRDLKEGEFSFELVEGEGEDAKVVATGTNNAEGNITMNAVKYTEAGKHTYTLREVNGGTTSKGITYGDAKYTIETTITDKGDGTLKAEHVLKDATAATFKNTYSVTPLDAELDFDLSKAIDGRDWTDSDEFSFTITAAEGTPLPDPATVTVNKHDAKDGIAAVKFGKIRYTAAGTYTYEIRENAGNAAGMAYDGHVATAEVTVTEDGEGKLTANVTKKENGRFTNTYRTELNYTAAGGLKLSKSLSGRPMTEGQFTFTVTPADEASANALGLLPGANNFKSPATAEATVGLIDILAGHEVKFTQADAGKTFTYTVAEKNDGKPGYTYDDAVRTVTIAVADDGAGTLTATTTVSGGPEGTHTTVHKSGENKVESALVPFHNGYSATTNTPGGTAAQVVATKTLTGRPMADGEFWFGIAYQGELVGYENLKPNIGGHVSFDALHYDTEMLANLEAAGLAHRTDKDGKLAWTINYTAYEDLFGLPNGVSATTWSFGFKVIVVDNGDGTLTATVDYGGVEPLFENVYGAEAVDAALIGTKKLQAAEGLAPADIAGKFTFTVTADEAGAPMPERTTATNDAAGNVDFGKIHFTLEDLNRALGVTDDATDKAEADEADEAEADEAEAEEADATDTDESDPATPTAPRSHTFTYTVTESGSAPGVTNDANATRKVSYTVTDDGTGHLSVVHEGDDGAAFTFTNTYGVAPTDSSATDQVKTVKRLTGRDLSAGEFTFELLEDGVVVASGTNDVNGNVTLSPIHYEAPGTHTYTLREACPNALGLYKGVTYDGTTYTVVTTVSDNGDGTLTVTHKLEGTTEAAGFTNKYHAMPTQVSIGAIKVLEGRELKKDEFSFKLVGEGIESTVTNDADGKISFDKFEYSEPGTHVYTISEVKGDEPGMTYDKSVFTATVNVVDDGEGNLKASVTYTKGDKSVEGIVFNNAYKKPETPVPMPDPGTPKTVTNIVKTVKGFLPTTGDQQAAALLMAFVIAMAGVGALVWGIRKR
ncbi:FctA domain-containing protein [Collinsella aerofaciens]|uniref:Spy0128 family protein n=1 Tax=Collinsella aerofaciens TaxID=74426 RepID=UPI00232EBECD|nr:FctA domain-containing protein [Collinsella aerofaciens]MDB1866378.1 FctA domain-containing protein [Collinsella aerofaciens]